MNKKIKRAFAGYTSDYFLIAGIAIYFVWYMLLLPDKIIMISDDFGYYSSVIKTIQEGTVMASDWLGPTNAFLAVICWWTYVLTGNFFISTMGVIALCSLAFFVLLYFQLRKKYSSQLSIMLTLAICTFPIYLVRSLDFFSLMPILTCLLISVNLYERKRWFWFFLVVLFAFSIRQSVVVLLALPLIFVFTNKFKAIARIFYGFILFIAGVVLIRISVTPGYVQENLENLDRMFESFHPIIFLNAILTGFYFFIIFLAFINLITEPALLSNISVNIKRNHIPLLFTIILVACFFLNQYQPFIIQIHTLGFKFMNNFPYVFFVVALLSVWSIDYSLFRIDNSKSWVPFFITSVCFVVLVSFRGLWGDAYFMELILFAVLTLVATDRKEQIVINRRKYFSSIILTALLIFNLGYSVLFGLYLEVKEQTTFAYESLLRNKILKVTEASSAPFGYLGWKLFPYFTKHDGLPYHPTKSFLNYVKSGSSYVVFQPDWINRFQSKIPDTMEKSASRLVLVKKVTIGMQQAELKVYHLPESKKHESILPGGSVQPLGTDYEEPLYPINNHEWRKILSTRRMIINK